jgi:hypothetical protein
MRLRPPQPEKEFGKDMKRFGQISAQTRELLILQQQAEKATGPTAIALDKAAREKAKLKPSPPSV